MISAGVDDLTIDAGIVQASSLGDKVWSDANGNGKQDGGENGISGVSVELYEVGVGKIADTTTNATGIYHFNNLLPGNYTVKFILPNGNHIFTQKTGALIDADNSDADPTAGVNHGMTGTITLLANENLDYIDAGIVLRSSIGDYVWYDKDGNGLQGGASEPGIAGVTVNLYKSGVTGVFATDTTDANGKYLFEDLLPGSYEVEFVLPAGHRFTQIVGTAPAGDNSNADPLNGKSGTIALTAGENNLTIDAGVVRPSSLGNFVWYDKDGNGLQGGTGEAGVQNVTVRLYKDGVTGVFATDTTDANGAYLFDDLLPGSYEVEFVLPANRIFTQIVGAAGDDTNSNANRQTGRSGSIALGDNENNLTIDAGIVAPASLGNFVWNDVDGNGLQGGTGESGIENVTVRLYKDGGTVAVATMPTNASGGYLFDSLIPGNYEVEFVLPTGHIFTQIVGAAGDGDNSNANRSTGRSGTIALTDGENNLTIDAGMVKRASIGDYVWYDKDGDGLQDASESGVAGVTVRLYKNGVTGVFATDTTDADGAYLFENLLPGSYEVEFVMPTGHIFTKTVGLATDGNNSKANPATGKTGLFNLGANEHKATIDAGVVRPSSLGNFVWYDKDGNGLQGGTGEAGVQNVTVRLYKDGVTGIFATDTTDANGAYLFDDLLPGSYEVEFVLPANRIFTQIVGAAGDDTNSNANRQTGRSGSIALGDNENNLTIDAGIVAPASLGNFVWNDVNGDGLQGGTGESGIENVTVRLYKDGGTVAVATMPTNASGGYLFDNLIPGNYEVEFVLPTGYIFTQIVGAAGDGDNSNANRSTGRSGTIALTDGENNLTIDAGMVKRASIGDYVWYDKDGDGLQDASESGVAGVTVRLYKNGVTGVFATDTTDADGAYLFENLLPGSYEVEFVMPTGHIFTKTVGLATDGNNSKANPATGKTGLFNLGANEHKATIDAGVVRPSSLGNFVWYDKDGNGLQGGTGEAGVQNVTVRLYKDGVTGIFATDTTDANGAYLFDDLLPGSYEVEFVLPANRIFTQIVGAAGDGNNSNANRQTGRSGSIALGDNENNLTIDAGIVAPASLGNFVWNDVDGNGLQGVTGESGIENVTVRLYKDGGAVAVATMPTNASGGYLFDNLIPGNYEVEFVLPTGYIFTQIVGAAGDGDNSNANRSTGRSGTIALTDGENNLTIDAGIVHPASVGDYVWNDLDGNGIQGGAGEGGIEHVTVRLYKDGALHGTTTTSATGAYGFNDLLPGNYEVEFVLPTGYIFTKVVGSNTDGNNSNADRVTGKTGTFALAASEHNGTIDAGIVQPASLGNYVWNDTGVIGVQEAGESGVNGIVVTLLDEAGNPVAGVPPMTTRTEGAADGYYLFEKLLPGKYKVKFEIPNGHPNEGYLFTKQHVAAGDSTTDSDVDRDGNTGVITLFAATANVDIDAGIVQTASLGDFVWDDVNGNGVQDPSEVGKNKVKVKLYDENNVLVGTTETADKGGNPGYYSFINLMPGNYRVEFEALPGYMFTIKGAGTNANNSDTDFEGKTEWITLIPGENNENVDAGIRLIPMNLVPAELGDYVWIDKNSNGVQDAGEVGLNGVAVELYNANGAIVATVVTANDKNGKAGYYLFKDVYPGNYSVKFVLPEGYEFTAKSAALDHAVDSDADADGRTTIVTLNSGGKNYTIDAGLVPLASVGDYVWLDANKNGVQDAGEAGQNGIEVTLYSEAGYKVASHITGDGPDGPGYYEFKSLQPGQYYVVFDLPVGYAFTKRKAGGTKDKDSDADESGKTDMFALSVGERNVTIDAGIYVVSKPDPEQEEPGTEQPGGETGTGTGSNPGTKPGTTNPGTDPGTNPGSENPKGDGKSGVPGDKGGDGKSGTTGGKKGTDGKNALPKTGESMPLLPIFGYALTILSLGLIATRWVLKKKAEKQQTI